MVTSHRFPVDLSLFANRRHSPSLPEIQRSLARHDLALQDFCIPVNPYFPPPEVFAEWRERLETILKYYPTGQEPLAELLADATGLDPATIVLGNGSTELIIWINLLFPYDRLAVPIPTFGPWIERPRQLGREVLAWRLSPCDDFTCDTLAFADFVRRSRADAVVLCNPNNPTGTLVERRDVVGLMDSLADKRLIVVDESFIDFADAAAIPSVADEAAHRDNVIVLKSLGKNCGLHGVRAGYLVTNPEWARRLRAALPEWNVNALAEALIRAFADHQADYEAARRRAVADRQCLERRLRTLPEWTVFPSRANFVYVRIPAGIDGVSLRDWLLTEFGILVRECGDKEGGAGGYFRVAARPAAQAESLLAALRAAAGHFRDDLPTTEHRLEPLPCH